MFLKELIAQMQDEYKALCMDLAALNGRREQLREDAAKLASLITRAQEELDKLEGDNNG